MSAELKAQLMRHEGLRLCVYDDANGKPIIPGSPVRGHPTIGIGRALDVNGITKDEAMFLLDNDIAKCRAEVLACLPWTKDLGPERLDVLINMSFNMGIHGLMQFKTTLFHVQHGEYAEAAQSMLGSLWAKQVPARAAELALQMKSGKRLT